MKNEFSEFLEQGFDSILYQISKGNTIEGLIKGRRYIELEQVKEWKSKFGFQFHIYSNDHLVNNEPHFHLIKKSEDIDCRMYFTGKIIDCKGSIQLDKKIIKAVEYFVSLDLTKKSLIELWNQKNPSLMVET